jgi:hypothetical protein
VNAQRAGAAPRSGGGPWSSGARAASEARASIDPSEAEGPVARHPSRLNKIGARVSAARRIIDPRYPGRRRAATPRGDGPRRGTGLRPGRAFWYPVASAQRASGEADGGRARCASPAGGAPPSRCLPPGELDDERGDVRGGVQPDPDGRGRWCARRTPRSCSSSTRTASSSPPRRDRTTSTRRPSRRSRRATSPRWVAWPSCCARTSSPRSSTRARRANIHIQLVGNRVILVVIFDSRATLGSCGCA